MLAPDSRRTIGAALSGRAPVIRSDGSPERDFLYVEDGAAAYVAIWRALLWAGGWGRRSMPVAESRIASAMWWP